MIYNVPLCALKIEIHCIICVFILVYRLYEYVQIIRTSEVYVRTSRILGLVVHGQVRFSQISPPLQIVLL